MVPVINWKSVVFFAQSDFFRTDLDNNNKFIQWASWSDFSEKYTNFYWKQLQKSKKNPHEFVKRQSTIPSNDCIIFVSN